MAAIAGYVPSATALRNFLEALPPAFLGETWAGVLRLLQHRRLDPNRIWPAVHYGALEGAFVSNYKTNVLMNRKLRPLWDVGLDVEMGYLNNQRFDRLRQLVPNLIDVDDVFGYGQDSARANVAKGVWTGCTIRLSLVRTQDDFARIATTMAAMPSLRELTLNLSQLAEAHPYYIPPEYIYHTAPFPASLEQYLWAALAASRILDLTLLGGHLVATTDGIASAIQWLTSRPIQRRVHRLCFDDVKVEANDVATLVTAMRECTTLSTVDLSYDRTLLPTFLSAPLPRHVRRLGLFVSEGRYYLDSVSLNITSLPVGLVVTAIAGSALTHLRLDVQDLDNQNIAAIVSTALERIPSLQHLELSNVRRGPKLTAVLEAGADRLAGLESVQLHELEVARIESPEPDVDAAGIFGTSDY
ncbi:hypothetical protein SDRG_16782 [Saprolegnia diclina VS20]|uniref:Uncharacterized protein n=1 Tax=Saprolegnia diclina (strain VS20) TaxID=1156394 RepID=T0R072_SAPDV|nr:hypothetical protein SDRG_16782 [Saprolegnia diclina VS20]EQC25373.1 hypothetical protein SDRG_16782 [Saprolegnia diclina VS20]|eukprot:XP_008621223.1 hypothetical protein SDRG_16782 [Saprolegnia diclina VS20]